MNSQLYTLEQAQKKLQDGRIYAVAGDEEMLKKLPPGNWIGGTIPYFLTHRGGVVRKDSVFLTEFPEEVQLKKIEVLDVSSIASVYQKIPPNGFALLILPAASEILSQFAQKVSSYPQFAARPLVGWISGVHLEDLGKSKPKTIEGQTGRVLDSAGVVLYLDLPAPFTCDVGIVNIFQQDPTSDSIEFLETGFTAKEVRVNGKRVKLVQYLREKKIQTQLPLIADYAGAKINVSFQKVDESTGEVNFYAPVFQGLEYRQALPLKDYVREFTSQVPKSEKSMIFSCNCILNFLYSGLEGNPSGSIEGPATFGEIAYQLLNQTMVYLKVLKK